VEIKIHNFFISRPQLENSGIMFVQSWIRREISKTLKRPLETLPQNTIEIYLLKPKEKRIMMTFFNTSVKVSART